MLSVVGRAGGDRTADPHRQGTTKICYAGGIGGREANARTQQIEAIACAVAHQRRGFTHHSVDADTARRRHSKTIGSAAPLAQDAGIFLRLRTGGFIFAIIAFIIGDRPSHCQDEHVPPSQGRLAEGARKHADALGEAIAIARSTFNIVDDHGNSDSHGITELHRTANIVAT